MPHNIRMAIDWTLSLSMNNINSLLCKRIKIAHKNANAHKNCALKVNRY